MKNNIIPGILLVLCTVLPSNSDIPDVVAGNVRQFNDNGAWSQFRNQRVVVDNINKMLIIGSNACSLGVDGEDRNGNVETAGYSIPTGNVDKFILLNNKKGSLACDNRNIPSFFIRPDGRYLAVYSLPVNPISSFYRLFSGELWAADWGDEQQFPWNETTRGLLTENAQLVYLSSESQLYYLICTPEGSFHFAISSDYGTTWKDGGQLLQAPPQAVKYSGYALYCSNENDRIDLILTEPGAVLHGYILDGKLHTTNGTVIDESIFDSVAVPSPEQLTKIFPDNSLFSDDAVQFAWCTDLQSYDEDTLVALVTIHTSDAIEETPDYRIVYCLFDGIDWNVSLVAGIGMKPIVASEKYSDQTALDPDDRNTLYVSTTIDPGNGNALTVHELFKGFLTADNGWQWEPITSRSLRDNLCPVVPHWNGYHKALLWMRGTCNSAYHYDAAIVGIIKQDVETLSKKRYVDSNRKNSFDGCCFDSLQLEYSEEDHDGDNRWHLNEEYGNEGTVIVSSETDRWEDALLIKQMKELEPGTYDLWANFWGKSDTLSDWLICASVEGPDVELHRQMACRTVDTSEYDVPPEVISIGDSLFLYEAYAGRATLKATGYITVFIDDHVTAHGSEFGAGGDVTRTWFDGISYAKIETPAGINNEGVPRMYSEAQLKAQVTPSGSHLCLSFPEPVYGTKPVAVTLYDLSGRIVLSRTFTQRQRMKSLSTRIPVGAITSGVYLCSAIVGSNRYLTKVEVVR